VPQPTRVRGDHAVPHTTHTRKLSAAWRRSGSTPDYGALWRKLFDEAHRTGQLRSDIDPRIAQLLVLGALNWTAEWWDPRRASVDSIVTVAQKLIHGALADVDRDGEPHD
jgi:Tetracyclin repressor-like, C-terminal domain